jgi:hypothetical protein
MSIQKQITVRYRAEGHVRFEIPEQLCDEIVATLLATEILDIEGVYRTHIFRKQGKLSIRFQEAVCDFEQLAKQLFKLFSELERKGLLVAPIVSEVDKEQNSLKSKIKDWKVSRWIAEKQRDVKETVQAAKVITKLGLKKQKLFVQGPEKAMIDFFNDILVLYLIKLHWIRITQEWIPKPWAFKYQWTAVFYLFYLLMRSRRPK